ncbi:DUF5695 domain-containing protein [Sphingomonas sanguinis]|jgi:hypothetical protein|uniref:Glycoside hydrolase n=1 Tax=Sphingomonas sanguinis TaxID=33051 RepID=A0A7Y7QV88_9SPHN|nr:DUF5695 domain-containing protein [Sphingomonas sanguinis]MBZ6381391.1 DUF5695 domain-containing protein [Sphingomonas sanguinis]NNG51032.1 hypothetical protein [Sphingomonas sanguinis]NNG53022.1 hypothetical protein [Sphingomonas sanguinis]NVP30693.1 hypothetical protein [Sphingomonas sanguinis]
MRHSLVRLVPMTLATLSILAGTPSIGAARSKRVAPAPARVTPGLRVGQFTLLLDPTSQTARGLSPIGAPGFDFLPIGRAKERAGNGYNHLGDIHLRLRSGTGEWHDYSSSRERRPVRALPARGSTLASADISGSMGADLPLRVVRDWVNDKGAPVLHFTLTNTSRAPVEIGGLGIPMVFDNIITDRTLEQAHAQASFADPYIGRDAGYVQVTRLNGAGPALLVLPERNTPLEAYVPIPTLRETKGQAVIVEASPRAQTSEGFYDWTIASAAYAQKEWAKAGAPWNEATSFTLAPGESRQIGLRLVAAPSIRAIEPTLAAQGRPVVVGVPGYVVPTDLDATLFVHAPSAITGIASYPAGALDVTRQPGKPGWTRLSVRGRNWGRARLTLTYADGSVQTVQYFVTKPLEQTMADLGRFSTTKQWFEGKGDPFGRSPAILTYDREAQKIVTADPRVWISGMSDEGGAGSWVAAVMKQLDNPNADEIARIEQLVDKTVVGHLQVADGDHAGGVKKSLFYYDPTVFPNLYQPAKDWQSWTSWKKDQADDLGRAYNYPHVAAGHWVLYRIARNHRGMTRVHAWDWYLDHAYQTIVAMMRDAPHYAQFGLMEGDVFVDILTDLKREGWTAKAAEVERLMKGRADHWRTLQYPFGSEMAWDSTGQAEVYAWMRYFGYGPQADVTREVILGYDPSIPHWGYNGNARRYWDFLYGGKYPRLERQIHHYGSTLNAIPLFDSFRRKPSDLHLLRVAYGGLMGGITNIDQDGASSAAFHSWPDRMQWDPYSGDYGMGFFGHAYAAGTYVVNDPALGWLSYGGNLSLADGHVRVVPRDGARARVFVAPVGLWLTLEAGKIAGVDYDPATGKVRLALDPATAATPAARLFVETTTPGGHIYTPDRGTLERGGYTVPLSAATTDITLSAR